MSAASETAAREWRTAGQPMQTRWLVRRVARRWWAFAPTDSDSIYVESFPALAEAIAYADHMARGGQS